jgi:hypothetical protein
MSFRRFGFVFECPDFILFRLLRESVAITIGWAMWLSLTMVRAVYIAIISAAKMDNPSLSWWCEFVVLSK